MNESAHEPLELANTSPVAKRSSSGSRVRRVLLSLAGWITVGLGLIGVVLPLVPTTPFLLLAAACFARSSPRLHGWLVGHPRLGPYLRQWQEDRSVPPGAKGRALLVVVVTFALSIYFAPFDPARVLLVLLGIGVLTFVARLRTA